MGKLIACLSLLYFSTSFALVPENFFQDDNILFEHIFEKNKFTIASIDKSDIFDLYAQDPLDKIDDKFQVTKYFYHQTKFWFNIYTQYGSTNVVLHDKKNLNIVYDVLDYQNMHNSELNRHTKYSLQNRFTAEKIKAYRKVFTNYIKDKKYNTAIYKKILKSLKRAKIKLPKGKKQMTILFKGLSENLRAQSGQRNHIKKGLAILDHYYDDFKYYFSLFRLPPELLAIPFLESSFNIRAKSKSNAVGLWQFMGRIGRHFMTINKSVDQRFNPYIATLSALQLLKQNKQILKRWDLAITAYNSGTKHLVKARRLFKKQGRKFSLENVFRFYKHAHHGFASKNFFSEFTALVYTMAYKEKFFKLKHRHTKNLFKIYVSKCKIKPYKIFLALGDLKKYKELNPHFLRLRKNTIYPRGSVIISDVKLTSRRYLLVSSKNLTRKYARNFKKLLGNKKCSKR